ncbi:LPXTG cell wall anchor domain-containing protein [Streptococcus hyointestinalis]|uniref:LPXTG cell wall anchor domain-containing protein n=1 Tax=Streptococcus hyointestinalis TaxID=1337 RepID=UPI003D042CD5
MTKKNVIKMVAISTIALSNIGVAALADEVVVGNQNQPSSGVVSDGSGVVIGENTSSTESSQGTSGSSSSNTGTVIGSDSSSTTKPSDGSGIVVDTGSSSETNPSESTPPSTEETTTPADSKTETTSPKEEEKPETEGKTEVEVPTTDGGTTTLTPDVTVPTNNPNISAEVADKAGASQVGTTSQVTGQVVQNVTPQAPIVTSTGYKVVSTVDSQLVVENTDGSTSTIAPETIGAKVNEDKTISLTTAGGETKTLPKTGDENTLKLVVLGLIVIIAGLADYYKDKLKQLFNKEKKSK